MNRKIIYILIGPKGSGKTFVGQLVEAQLGIPFLRVEDIALKVKKDRAVDDTGYVREVFRAIEQAVREKVEADGRLVFESIGLTDDFDQMLRNLRRDCTVKLVGLKASPALCLERVRRRDASVHIDVSDQQVEQINVAVLRKHFTFDGQIDNDQALPGEIIRQFKAMRHD